MEKRIEKVALRLKNWFWSEVAKLLLFDRDPEKTVDFVMVYKLYIRIKMEKKLVEKQVY